MTPSHAALLRKHRPILRYDSNECYFADSAAEWTDHHGNRLKRDSEILATAGGEGGAPDLSLEFLAGEYPGAIAAEKSDLIDCPDQNYVADAAEMHQRSAYRNKMYGRVRREPNGGSLWLQYWFFYFYNDFNLIGSLIKAGLHEGDWEMIQLRLDEDEVPDLAVYAQHTGGDHRSWVEVERPDGGDRPVVYVARGSHASYFDAGIHWTGHWWDHADGERKSPEVALLAIDIDPGDWGWTRWPGHWGGTVGGSGLLDDSSPSAPIEHGQWHDPAVLLPKAAATEARMEAVVPPELPVLKSAVPRRSPGGLAIEYVAMPVGDEALLGLAVTVNSVDEPGVPPSTYPIESSAPAGTVSLAVPLDPKKRYDVTVSAAFEPNLATESIRTDLPPDPAHPGTPPTPPAAES
jgi:hypothetical protein